MDGFMFVIITLKASPILLARRFARLDLPRHSSNVFYNFCLRQARLAAGGIRINKHFIETFYRNI